MAELILTDAEKAAELWTDLDDQALGALMRKKLIQLKTAAEQMDRAIATTCALLLCCDAAEAGAAELTVTVDGVTQAGREFGDWQVVAKRLTPNVGIEPPYSVGSNDGLGPCIRSEEMVMDNGHDSDCATHNAPAYPAGPCDCMPTQAMCRAAVVYLNGADVYDKLPREVLEIEEGIYAEVWKAMRAAGPANAENVDEG